MTLQADLNALGADAATWDGISSALSSASGGVAGLDLGTPELSWAAEVTGLTTTYADFQEKLIGLLDGGTTEASNVAGALRQIKAAYEDTDTTARDQFDGLWEFTP